MNFLQTLQDNTLALAPTFVAVIAVALVLKVTGLLLERRRVHTGAPRVMSQAAMAVLAFLGLLIIILVLPVNDTTRGQLYSLLGILVSASIALSSSTIVGNAMGGLLIRFISGSRVRPGDYIRVEGHVGRVTEMGILHTQIQTETRDVTWLPNLWLVGRPATLRQATGTIVNATVGLGYDANRGTVRAALLSAAERVGLSRPFVRIEDLGDFTVTYKVGGLLTDLTRLLETHSQLRGAILDALHQAGVEVASPVLQTERVFPTDHVFIPRSDESGGAEEIAAADELMFDQAAAAAASHDELEAIRTEYESVLRRRDATVNPAKRRRLAAEIERLAKRLDALGG
jgi:small-conductance mechanosensitive channel